MIWHVRLFAYLKDRHGASIDIEAEATVDALLAALAEKGFPAESCRLAVNQEFARPGQSLKPGDELALIPPVSGG